MRELKFRAWDEEAECFTYSDKEEDFYVWGFEKGKLKAWAIVENPGSIDEPPYPESVELCKPYPFIGLLDKNDKRIYGGDIVQWLGFEVRNGKQIRPARKFVVEWTFSGLFRLENIVKDNGTAEIIGNIYENSEFLKEA